MPTLTIDGARFVLDCPPDTPLLWAIRDGAGLTGARTGCLVGLCGACTVHLDGAAVRPCSVPVSQAEGAAVTTIDGLLRTPLGRVLEQTWLAQRLPGCDQCRPGRIMAAAALLGRDSEPAAEEIDAILAAHVCDCGDCGDGSGFAGILIEAAQHARAPACTAERPAIAVVDAPSRDPSRQEHERTHR